MAIDSVIAPHPICKKNGSREERLMSMSRCARVRRASIALDAGSASLPD